MQLHQLGLGVLEQAYVVVPGKPWVHEHAPFDAPDDRIGLVAGEIGAQAIAQQPQNSLHLTGRASALIAAAEGAPTAAPQEELRNGAGYIRHGQHLVGESRGNHTARHAVELRLGGVLYQYQPAFGLQFARAARSVAPGARQHNAHGELALRLCQRGEEHIDWQVQPLPRTLLGHTQHPTLNREIGLGRVEVHRVRLDAHAVFGAHNAKRGVPPQQLDHEGFVIRRQMLHHHVRNPAVGIGIVEKLLQRFEPTSAGANGTDGQHRVLAARRGGACGVGSLIMLSQI